MVKSGDKAVVLWPRYFNAKLSRAQGRRVPRSVAVKDPDAKWIEAAAKKAGFRATLEEDATDPRLPFKPVGRVLVEKDGSKEAVIQAVAKQMASTPQ